MFHPKLGAYFKSLRDANGFGLRQAAQIASNRGLTALSKSALFALEKGKTKNLDRDVMEALATLYGVSADGRLWGRCRQEAPGVFPRQYCLRRTYHRGVCKSRHWLWKSGDRVATPRRPGRRGKK